VPFPFSVSLLLRRHPSIPLPHPNLTKGIQIYEELNGKLNNIDISQKPFWSKAQVLIIYMDM